MVHVGEAREAAWRGTLLFYHGFVASKESQFKELDSLARAGFLAIGVDNVGHGARRYPDFRPQDFFPVALLSQNAARDENVPARHARALHETLAPLYAAHPEREAYLEYPESGHFMLEHEWNDLWHHTVAWYERFRTGDFRTGGQP